MSQRRPRPFLDRTQGGTVRPCVENIKSGTVQAITQAARPAIKHPCTKRTKKLSPPPPPPAPNSEHLSSVFSHLISLGSLRVRLRPLPRGFHAAKARQAPRTGLRRRLRGRQRLGAGCGTSPAPPPEGHALAPESLHHLGLVLHDLRMRHFVCGDGNAKGRGGEGGGRLGCFPDRFTRSSDLLVCRPTNAVSIGVVLFLFVRGERGAIQPTGSGGRGMRGSEREGLGGPDHVKSAVCVDDLMFREEVP